MILTPDFVFIHYPKTGGTFITDTLAKLYADRGGIIDIDKHGTCTEIPESHQDKPVVTVMRNPFDRYVSQYHYGWWKDHPELYCGAAAMQDMYPHYPEISFEEFVKLACSRFVNAHREQPTGFENENLTEGNALGWHTETFVRFYFRNPRQVFASLTEESLGDGSFQQEMYNVHFLHTENLNQEIYDYLLSWGHAPEDLGHLLEKKRVLPTLPGQGQVRNHKKSWQSYYTPELVEYVRHRERLIFSLFPEYDLATVGG